MKVFLNRFHQYIFFIFLEVAGFSFAQKNVYYTSYYLTLLPSSVNVYIVSLHSTVFRCYRNLYSTFSTSQILDYTPTTIPNRSSILYVIHHFIKRFCFLVPFRISYYVCYVVLSYKIFSVTLNSSAKKPKTFFKVIHFFFFT